MNIANDLAFQKLIEKLMRINPSETLKWKWDINTIAEYLFFKWDINSYRVNTDSYTGLVLECQSSKYGETIVKIYPSFLNERFIKEHYILSKLCDYPSAKLLSLDEENDAFLMERIIPGDFAYFSTNMTAYLSLLEMVNHGKMLVTDELEVPSEIMGVVQQTEKEFIFAREFHFEDALIKELLAQTQCLYEREFADSDKYLLHGDIYYRNALVSRNGIKLIDPVGYVDAFIFEYMPFLTYEIVKEKDPAKIRKSYDEIKAFLTPLVPKDNIDAATFIFLVKQLIPSIYEANDNFQRANSFLVAIKALFFEKGNILI